jgi:hypothetical protein
VGGSDDDDDDETINGRRIGKKEIVPQSKVLYRDPSGGTKENHEHVR